MKNKMNINTFANLLNEKGWLEAIKYKDSLIPKILYKYYPIFDDRYVDYENENKIRFNTLSSNEIWVSNYKTFNDPFEFKMFTLDIMGLKRSSWDVKLVEQMLEKFKERTLVSCFTSEVDNNMPLWAHYANNHSGYCVRYAIINPRNIYPVSYEPVRTKVAVIPTMLISEIAKSYNEKPDKPAEDCFKYLTYFNLSLTCKHEFWNYENEFRLLYHYVYPVSGLTVSLEDVGLYVEAIYMGMESKDKDKQELISIGKKLRCDVFEMYFDEYSDVFELKTNKLYSRITI